MKRAYEDEIDFIAAGPSTKSVARCSATPAARARIAALIRREKAGELSAEEVSELDHSLVLEHLMRLAKAQARSHLAGR